MLKKLHLKENKLPLYPGPNNSARPIEIIIFKIFNLKKINFFFTVMHPIFKRVIIQVTNIKYLLDSIIFNFDFNLFIR